MKFQRSAIFVSLMLAPVAFAQTHSADIDTDSAISLSEALRVIQFFNLDELHCDGETEDGFAPGPGARECVPHNSDYNPQDWSVDLSELLRLIQLFNSLGYVPDDDGEDGFAPVFSTEPVQVEVIADADAALFENDEGALANGSGIYLFAGQTAVGELRRSVLHFDVAGAIPAGATIASATLRLHLSRTNLDAGPQVFDLHRAETGWNEGPSDAPAEEGTGIFSESGDTTWLHTFYDNQFWSTPGGDFAASVSATQTADLIGFYSWTSAGLAADVQAWLDSPATNFGWFLLGPEGQNLTAKRFDAREHPESARRPTLIVSYTAAQ